MANDRIMKGWERRNNRPAPLAGFGARPGASPWKAQKLEESSLRLIREQLIDLEPRNAAAILVGMCPNVYTNDALAIQKWTAVVEREQTLRTKSLRAKNAKELRAERSQSSVERRQRFLLATAKLDSDEAVSTRSTKYIVIPGPSA
jgi:hypothetical protein